MSEYNSPKLLADPVAFQVLTGVTPVAFGAMVAAVQPVVAAAEAVRRMRPGRKRAPGAGRPHSLALPDRLLAAVLVARFGRSSAFALQFLLAVRPATVGRAAAALVPVLRASGFWR